MFTTTQIKEIAQKLQAMGLKDSQFPQVSEITGNEDIACIQNGDNAIMKVSLLASFISDNVLKIISNSLKKWVTLTIVPEPSDSEVMINGEIRSSVELTCGELASVRVSKEGYDTMYGFVPVFRTQEINVTLTERKVDIHEVGIGNLLISKDENSMIDPESIPSSGGEMRLRATADILYSNGTLVNRDVTDRTEWDVTDPSGQGGIVSRGEGVFQIAANTGRSSDEYEVIGKVRIGDSVLVSSVRCSI